MLQGGVVTGVWSEVCQELEEIEKTSTVLASKMSSSGPEGRVCQPKNPFLATMESDFLYHIGYSSHDCKDTFKDVKVLIGLAS